MLSKFALEFINVDGQNQSVGHGLCFQYKYKCLEQRQANSHTLINVQLWLREGRGKLCLCVVCQDQYIILVPRVLERKGGQTSVISIDKTDTQLP